MKPHKLLKCETNTTEMQTRIEEAFKVSDYYIRSDADERIIWVEFEHGQWWVTFTEQTNNDSATSHGVNGGGAKGCTNSFSVVDAVGGKSIDGFDFEEL